MWHLALCPRRPRSWLIKWESFRWYLPRARLGRQEAASACSFGLAPSLSLRSRLGHHPVSHAATRPGNHTVASLGSYATLHFAAAGMSTPLKWAAPVCSRASWPRIATSAARASACSLIAPAAWPLPSRLKRRLTQPLGQMGQSRLPPQAPLATTPARHPSLRGSAGGALLHYDAWARWFRVRRLVRAFA